MTAVTAPASRARDERVAVEVLLRPVVTQLEGRVGEVPQHVPVVDPVAELQRTVQGSRGGGPVALGHLRHRDQQVTQAQRPRRIAGDGHDEGIGHRQRRTAVGAEGAHDGSSNTDVEGPGRIDRVDRLGGLHEDPVRLGRRPQVDLDMTTQACDISRSKGSFVASRAFESSACAWPPGRRPRRSEPRRR